MTTLAIKDGDLYLDTNNNIALWREDLNILKQNITNNIQTFLSEVFTDTRIGVDYYGIIFNDRLPLIDKQQEFSKTILQIEGVKEIEEFNFELDKENRIATYNIKILTIYGSIGLNDMGVEF